MKMNYQKPEAELFEVYLDRLMGEEMSTNETGSGEGTGDDSRSNSNNNLWWEE